MVHNLPWIVITRSIPFNCNCCSINTLWANVNFSTILKIKIRIIVAKILNENLVDGHFFVKEKMPKPTTNKLMHVKKLFHFLSNCHFASLTSNISGSIQNIKILLRRLLDKGSSYLHVKFQPSSFKTERGVKVTDKRTDRQTDIKRKFNFYLTSLIAPTILKLEESLKIKFLVQSFSYNCYFVNFPLNLNCGSY